MTEDELTDLYTRLSSNDPVVTEVVVDRCGFPKGYCVALGEALRGNTRVSKLTLHMDHLLSTEQRRTVKSTVKSLAPLVQYIQSGSALRALTLTSARRPALPVVRRLLSAAATNNALEELSLDSGTPVSDHVDVFCRLMQQTISLRRLEVYMWSHSPIETQERVAAALGSNQTLECLVFYSISSSTESILLELSTHPFLKKLRIRNNTYITTNLNTLVQSNASQLRDLELEVFKFDNRAMDGLVLGLRDNTTLEKLSFRHCSLDDDATEQFLQFFGKNECNVRELALLDCFRFGMRTACEVTLELLRHNQSLDKVTYRGEYDDFIKKFASIATNVRLKHLDLHNFVRETDWTVLGRLVLPNARLQELTLPSSPAQPETAASFLEGLRCNGSLHQVHFSKCITSFSTADTLRMEAYLARNRYVSQCWAPSNSETNDEIHRLIFPRVTLAVQPIRTLSPNMILTGLVDMEGDGIGPQHNTLSLSGSVRVL